MNKQYKVIWSKVKKQLCRRLGISEEKRQGCIDKISARPDVSCRSYGSGSFHGRNRFGQCSG